MNESELYSQDKSYLLDQEYRSYAETLLSYGQNRRDGDYLHPVFGSGNITSDIFMIGEAPGKEEASAGTPFVGKAGKTLNRLLSMIDVDRNEIYISNVVKYRPWTQTEHGFRNRTPSKNEIENGLALLSKEIKIIGSRFLVTLGNTPLYAVCKVLHIPYETIGAMHGKLYQAENSLTQIYPAYHPASCIYNRSLEKVLEEDMLNLRSILKGQRQEGQDL